MIGSQIFYRSVSVAFATVLSSKLSVEPVEANVSRLHDADIVHCRDTVLC